MPKAKTARKSPPEDRAEVTARNAKGQFGALLSRVGFGNERIAITRHGKRIAALVSAQDLETLDGAA